MSTKIQVIANENLFAKLGADVESKIVQTLDAKSALAYLSTSKRTSPCAAQEGWKLVLRDLRRVASIQLPTTITVDNIDTFHAAFASAERQLRKVKRFIPNVLTDKSSVSFSFMKEHLFKIKKVVLIK